MTSNGPSRLGSRQAKRKPQAMPLRIAIETIRVERHFPLSLSLLSLCPIALGIRYSDEGVTARRPIGVLEARDCLNLATMGSENLKYLNVAQNSISIAKVQDRFFGNLKVNMATVGPADKTDRPPIRVIDRLFPNKLDRHFSPPFRFTLQCECR